MTTQKRKIFTFPRMVAFWLVAGITATLLAASSVPTRLYPVFQAEFGFSAITLIVIFAVYVFALLLSLLTVGRLSDFVGRVPVLVVALVVEAASMAIFFGAQSVAWLLAARIVQGVATGAAIGVLSAYLLDLQPGGASRMGTVVAGAAPTFGLGLGAIVTGVLVQYAPHPTRLVFAGLTVLFVAIAIATVALPETVHRVPGAVAALRPQIQVPPRIRPAFAAALPTMISTWALGGLVLSVGGSLLASVFSQPNHAIVGAVLGLFAVAGATAAILTRNLSAAGMTRLGTATLVLGSVLFIVALALSSIVIFIASSLFAGGGFGAAFLGALRSVTQSAKSHERAALLSAIYVVSYLAFSIPALVAGLFIGQFGLRDTALAYAIFVGIIATGALAYEQIAGRRIQQIG